MGSATIRGVLVPVATTTILNRVVKGRHVDSSQDAWLARLYRKRTLQSHNIAPYLRYPENLSAPFLKYSNTAGSANGKVWTPEQFLPESLRI